MFAEVYLGGQHGWVGWRHGDKSGNQIVIHGIDRELAIERLPDLPDEVTPEALSAHFKATAKALADPDVELSSQLDGMGEVLVAVKRSPADVELWRELVAEARFESLYPKVGDVLHAVAALGTETLVSTVGRAARPAGGGSITPFAGL